ncbi:MAG: hypothetical protein B6I24_07580 [Bacteroidetes bacterium 4572_128]|nr:MAG: hypothetical protein B6I24_07580 [Bacteroidetes bacterium 4572_128]
MKFKDEHKTFDGDNFFEKIEIPFEKTKEEIWENFSKNLLKKKAQKRKKFFSIFKMSVAAAIIFISGISYILKFQKETIFSKKAEHISHKLPDGSIIELNAETSISYNKIFWFFKREVFLKGEAFFEVKKGEKFKIFSDNGITEILGTSFNIYARDDNYKVFCKTGKVKVLSRKTDIKLIINPNEIALLNDKNKNGKIEKIKSENVLFWKENKFNFNSENIVNVFKILERQYNVNIKLEIPNSSEYIYTAYFKKPNSIENTLNLICKTFNLNFIKIKENQYKIYHK